MRKSPAADAKIGVVAVERVLILVPIIHTQADLGALAEPVRREFVKRFGERHWQSKVNAIDRMWDELEACLLAPDLPYQRFRIYQDGLPICGREMDIVRQLAAAGSRNHRLLSAMVDRGAHVVGTESAELLVREYARARRLVETSATPAEAQDAGPAGRTMLEERDRAIAGRIGATLSRGEIGILFLGMLHSIAKFLPRDIRRVDFVPFGDNRSRLRQAIRAAS